MATHAGNLGSVKIGANTVLEIDKWSLNIKPGTTDTQSFGDTWVEKTLTISSWDGSFSGRLDQADTNGHVALRTAYINGTTVALRLYTTATTYYSGTAFIDAKIDADESGLVTTDYTFTGSGAVTFT